MLLNDLQTRVFTYQKAGDVLRLSVLRFLLAALKNKEIELRVSGGVITDEVVKKVIEKQIKQHNDSIESYKKGNRQDLVDKETSELRILEEFLAL
ncbi:MAG: GatB/YqeY domain-containing protein [Patescibacteria group bacterium]|jgi:hypothetical protein